MPPPFYVSPQLYLDRGEKWRPVPLDESLEILGYRWRDSPHLDHPHFERDGVEVNKLDFPATMRPSEFARLDPTGYHRVVKGGLLFWHQFFTWWPYNPKSYAGFGPHEGDWEAIQFGCTDKAGRYPILVTCSQHNGGERREYWRVRLDDDKRPVFFVARDSHASYFDPHQDVTDTADGEGDKLTLTWREFGSWQDFPEKWGNSDNSPGPLFNRRIWLAPHAYHSQARG